MKDSRKPKDGEEPDDDPEPPKTGKKAPTKANGSLAATINALYYADGHTPQADSSLSLSNKIRDRVLNRLRSKGFRCRKRHWPRPICAYFRTSVHRCRKKHGQGGICHT